MEAATEYLLSDFNDTSTYLSAQIYRDNAINPCMESTYRFVRELVQQVKTIHQVKVYYYVFILSAISPCPTGLKALFNQSNCTGTAPTHK